MPHPNCRCNILTAPGNYIRAGKRGNYRKIIKKKAKRTKYKNRTPFELYFAMELYPPFHIFLNKCDSNESDDSLSTWTSRINLLTTELCCRLYSRSIKGKSAIAVWESNSGKNKSLRIDIKIQPVVIRYDMKSILEERVRVEGTFQ